MREPGQTTLGGGPSLTPVAVCRSMRWMNLREALSLESVSLALQGQTKDAILRELVDLLARSGRLRDRDQVLKAVLDREGKMSTGMQNGIAIPHGKTDAAIDLVAAFGLKPEGIDFESLDGQPARVFVMTVSPDSHAGPHIQFLAEISCQLNDAAIREKLFQLHSAEAVLQLLTG